MLDFNLVISCIGSTSVLIAIAIIAIHLSLTDFIHMHVSVPMLFCVLQMLLFLHTAIVCHALPAITHGSITYAPETTPDYHLSTVATYACSAGFVLDLGGSVLRTCVDDMDNDAEGVFNGQAPICIGK